jgi:hypothetical protein
MMQTARTSQPRAAPCVRRSNTKDSNLNGWSTTAPRRHACATSPFRVADDSCRGRRFGRRGGTCRRRRVLSGLSGRARTFRRPVGREYRRGNRESRGACEHAADIKVASLWRARVGRNGGNRTTGNRLVPFCKQRRLNHSKQLYMIGTDSSNSHALPTSRAVAAFSRAVCEMAGGNVHSVEGWEELLLPGRFAQLRGRGCRWNGSRLAARAPGAGASLGAAAAFRRCTARRRCAILDAAPRS